MVSTDPCTQEPLVGTITEQSVRAWLSKHLAHGPSELESAEETQQWLAAAGPKVLAVLPLHASQVLLHELTS